jgi:hypothetical protein
MSDKSKTPKHLYDQESKASKFSKVRDDDYFAANEKTVCRVRPIIEGESPAIDAVMSSSSDYRSYAIVINHKRSKDKRKSSGIGIYPVLIKDRGRDKNIEYLKEEAKRFVGWFKKSSSTPPPKDNNAVII